MRIQWRYQPCPCLLAGGLASIWEAVSPLFSTSLVVRCLLDQMKKMSVYVES